MKKWYKILVHDKTELKTIQQLSMLNIRTFVPYKDVPIFRKNIQQLMENNIIYAHTNKEGLIQIQKLPFIMQITLCNTDPSSSPSEVS